MLVYTAQYRYPGPGRLDITVKGQDPVGRIMAPTWDMVMGHKNGTLGNEGYVKLYYEQIERTKASSLALWQQFLRMGEVTLVCFCKAGAFCHRVEMAKVLVEWGHTYVGERLSPSWEVPK
jgi:hypothetical protein